MKYAALLAALFYIVIGIVGLASPETLMAARQHIASTAAGLYAGGVARIVMGLVLILAAPASRTPKILRVLGTVICVQGLAAILSGVDRARAVIEFEASHTAYLPVGATLALASGGFIAFVVMSDRYAHR
jgi:uncharacterized membrane protein